MNAYEIVLVTALVGLIGGVFWTGYRSPDRTVFWNPLTLFATVFAYYFVVGPLIALALHNTSAYGMEFRGMMWKSWLAGLLGLSSIYAGFAIRARRFRTKLVAGVRPDLRRRLWIYFWILFGLGLLGFAYDAYVSGQPLSNLLLPLHQGASLDAL